MSKLFDAYGNPVDLKILKEELAAPGIGSVRQVISDHPSSDLSPQKLTHLLREAECGDAKSYLDLAEDMETKYLHYAAQLRTRKLACAGLDLVVNAASEDRDDQMAADMLRETLDGLDMWDVLMDSLDGLSKGYSVLEILWDTEGRTWRPESIVWREPRWFRYDVFDGTTLLLLDGGYGTPLAPYKFIYHRPRLKSGLPIKGGLAIAAAWAYLFSNTVMKDWVVFCEVFGQPIRVGKYTGGTSEEQIRVLKTAVNTIGTDCAAVIPEGMLIEFVESAQKNATGALYESFCRYLDERVTVAILGQTLTSGQTHGGGGSLALGRVHEAVRYDLLEADARQLSATLTQQLAKPIVDLNLGPRKAYPKIELFIKQNTDLTALADQMAKLVPLGLRVDAAEVREKYGLSDPAEDAEVLSAPQYGGDSGQWLVGSGQHDHEPSEPTETAAPTEAPLEGHDAQRTALNGAQVASLLQILELAAKGVIPKESAGHVIKAAFLDISDEDIKGMLEPIVVKALADQGADGWTDEAAHSAAQCACGCHSRSKTNHSSDVSLLTDQLEHTAAEAMDGLLEPIRRLVANAKSYDEVIEGILDCYPDMDVSSFAETLKEALTAVSLAGHVKSGQPNGRN